MGSVRGLGEGLGRLPRMLVSHFPILTPPKPQRAQRVPWRGAVHGQLSPHHPAEGSGLEGQDGGVWLPSKHLPPSDESVKKHLKWK